MVVIKGLCLFKILSVVALSAVFGAALPAKAETSVNMATITCDNFKDAKEDAYLPIIFWFHGYFGAQKNDTIIDENWIAGVTLLLTLACAGDDSRPLMQILSDFTKG